MQQQPDTTAHSAAGIAPNAAGVSVRAASPWSVTALEVLPAFKLKVRFHDGLQGVVDTAPLIHSPEAGVFAVLRDEAIFAQARIEYGAVTWPDGGPDLAPDAMHRAIAESGTWTP